MPHILYVEDDDSIRDMVLYALSAAGFQAEGFSGGGGLFERLEKGGTSLVLLDIMLPGEDGMTILQRLKRGEKTKDIPVIMMTAKGSELDRIRGLDLGADDYIAKPFSVLEVISRVKAVLRRCQREVQGDKALSAGAVTLRADRRSVVAQGQEVALTYKEFELLHCLMVNHGIVLTRDQLLAQVWGFDYSGESRTVDMHIKALRQKLGSCGGMIKTVRNVGYKLEEKP